MARLELKYIFKLIQRDNFNVFKWTQLDNFNKTSRSQMVGLVGSKGSSYSMESLAFVVMGFVVSTWNFTLNGSTGMRWSQNVSSTVIT